MAGNLQSGAAIGIPWYKRDDYRRIVEIMSDGEVFPPTFDKWQKEAEYVERRVKSGGGVPIRAHVDPEKFISWCASNKMEVGPDGRSAWAAETAKMRIQGGH